MGDDGVLGDLVVAAMGADSGVEEGEEGGDEEDRRDRSCAECRHIGKFAVSQTLDGRCVERE